MIIISIILLIFSTKYLSLIWIIFLLGLFLLSKKMYKYFLYFIIGLFIGFVSINNVPHYAMKNEYVGVVVSKKIIILYLILLVINIIFIKKIMNMKILIF